MLCNMMGGYRQRGAYDSQKSRTPSQKSPQKILKIFKNLNKILNLIKFKIF